MAIFNSQGNPANEFFRPVMSAVDMMTEDAIRVRESEKERQLRREYWQEQDKRTAEEKEYQGKRDRATRLFQYFQGLTKEEDITSESRQEAASALNKLLLGGDVDLNRIKAPEFKKQEPKQTMAITPLIAKYYPKYKGREDEEVPIDVWKLLNAGAQAQDKEAQERYLKTHPTPKDKKDEILIDINSKMKSAQEMSKAGLQNESLNEKGEIVIKRTPVDRSKYAKYIKTLETLKDKKASGKWTNADQQFLDSIQEYDYYESSGEDIPTYGKPKQKKKISGVNWVR